ncbi:MAG TPA: spermine/spermidine synthase [Bacillota bacterium]|jgi:spermidine synthase|nr:spermine/spermidine synthase [Bacillota bacterium]HOP68547.1 spermine/spermidine synthase [Bacillota bacterium]HPT33224.1 spermine/spermidine synthase [Bacillota bacterium]HPZ64287.1 spermine/spermidine synthase [Bacillota bacterium]HQD05617.1 spermine/spermidine synthase [Bacillota bacterium]
MTWFRNDPPLVLERTQGLGGEIQLQKRGEHFEIIYNGVFLMATYNGLSERLMVRRALELLGPERECRVLIGGLGVGYSLQEALLWPRVKAVKVVEIEPAVVRWNRTYLKEINGRALEDRRLAVEEEALERVLERPEEAGRWDLIVVDTDNGSSWLSRPANRRLYQIPGLQALNRCLCPGGWVSFWSSRPEADLEARLKQCFRRVLREEVLEETGQAAYFYLACQKDDREGR